MFNIMIVMQEKKKHKGKWKYVPEDLFSQHENITGKNTVLQVLNFVMIIQRGTEEEYCRVIK